VIPATNGKDFKEKGTTVSTARDQEVRRRFLDVVAKWLVSLPHDLRVLFEAKDEPNLEREARETAAGAILYILGPDTSGEDRFFRYADDAILFRAALAKVKAAGGEGAPAFSERFDEYYTDLDASLDVCREAMGPTFDWLSSKVEGLPKQTYKGKKLALYIDDDEAAELLYADGLAFETEYPIDENKLSMRLKKPETLLDPLRRMAEQDGKRHAS
jgi:hypothetical protein